MMKRRTLAGLTVGVVVVSSALGWVAASQIRSPAEEAARTAPPSASPILVPVEERVLSTDIVTRGTGRFGAPTQITLPPSGLKPDTSLVTTLPLVGAELAEGDVMLTTSGRPVFLLSGSRPSFRDLGPGIDGYDVQQLEEGLVRLGFDPGPVDGTYDTQTEAAVSAWYTGAGFAAIKATDAQVAAIRALEQDLSSAQLDILSAKDRVATARADLVAAQAARITAVDGISKAASPAEIQAAEADLAAALTAQTSTRLTGEQTIASAQHALDQAPAALAAAQAEAAAANQTAANDVATKQAALDLVRADPSATPAAIQAAEADLAAALTAQTSTRLTGEQTIASAQHALDQAPAALAAAQAEAAAANQTAANDVATKQATLDRLLAGTVGTPVEISAARSELDIATASVTAAATVLDNAKSALVVAEQRGLVVSGDLDTANRQAGVYVPSDEVVFIDSVPLRIAENTVVVGAPATGPIMTITNSSVAIDSSLPLEEAPLVKEGMTVLVDEPQLGLTATGVVSRVATSPGTDGVDGFHIYFVIAVDSAPPGLVGSSVRLTIPIESTGGAVLAVPVSALSMTTDGTSRVQTSAAGVLAFVTVEPGLSANGYVGVIPTDGSLVAGDLVVVGFEQVGAPSG
jgi:multidrug efflux pump subunit AcrA (membrane-fusion protein)